VKTLTQRADHVTEVVPITALDGSPLTLVHITGRDAPTRGPVLLAAGAGVRGEIFRPPLPRTLIDALLDEGWDVWLFNWRGSMDLPAVPWTLDQAAAYDHPAAVQAVLNATGADTVKAIVHCAGSATFSMSAAAGLVPQVDTVISNGVSLFPVVPPWSKFKIQRVAPLTAKMTPYISPAWGNRTEGWGSKAVTTFVRATHPECDNTVCRMVSFTFGSGFPALWSHANLDRRTHEWLRGEFGPVPMSFFRQMAKSVRAGHIVPDSPLPGLPASYVAQEPATDARFVFFAGTQNRCFLPESQQHAYDFFAHHRPGRDSLYRIRGYGHLDIFFGKHAATDVHPLILEELAR
jgi:alpha/beta hydrolase family protein